MPAPVGFGPTSTNRTFLVDLLGPRSSQINEIHIRNVCPASPGGHSLPGGGAVDLLPRLLRLHAHAARRAVARLGLASEVEASTSEQVLSKMEAMALEVSSGALPSVVRGAAVQALVSMAALAAPLPALADDVPQLQPVGQAMAPQQMQVSGRVTYSRRAHDVFSPGR